ncbi:MAG TPA: decaprenyl-phosphate phosphoribosyltransferase [Chloroflexia bacterium]|nr:decaprenyl-phosphate phosphoribosyltransferase [Chloroflexia bacterium]
MFTTLKLLVRTMRPKQWVKNAIVYAGVVFDRHLFEPRPVIIATLAFIIFCAISSAVYLLNDLVDIEKDRQHPRKRNRPLASGKLNKSYAVAALIVLVAVGLPLGFVLQPYFGLSLLAYFILQIAYCFYLKNVVIIDVFAIASGFVLRAVAGAFAIQVEVSPWLLVCTMLLALFLGLAKRRHELVLLAEGAAEHRQILKDYSAELVQEMISVVTSAVVIAYSLYSITYEKLPKNHLMALTIPFVLYAIFRYLYLVYKKDEGGSPEELLLRDIPLLACILLWGVTSVSILYFFPA